MKTAKNIFILSLFCSSFVLSCAEEEIGPVLSESSTFSAPLLKSPSTAAPFIIIPENASEVFEDFVWEKTKYNIPLASDYVVQMDDNEEFDSPKTLATTSGESASVSNRRFNDVMLSLGLPGWEESTVYVRVRSTLSGVQTSDTLYSNVIARTVTTFQSSECGNFCSMGIIGSATPGGWDTDSDMRLADPGKVDKSTWVVVIYLEGGQEVKFRAGDDWANNWGGGSAFPTGTATPGGDNIPIPTSSYYKVEFNDESGEYSFEMLTTPAFSTIGVIGDATPGGWDADTDLTQDPDNENLWTGTIILTDGEVKFRAEDDWADNWGAATFPSGYGVGGGDNIPVKAGTYYVQFNSVTGEYAFMRENHTTPFATVGIIGSATPDNWDSDTDMIQNPTNPYLWSKTITLKEGEAKFRADDDWADNWGGTDFPGGIGSPGGSNIPVREGTYFVTIHTGTGEYYFLN